MQKAETANDRIYNIGGVATIFFGRVIVNTCANILANMTDVDQLIQFIIIF